jgi:hypothetical protein
MGQRAGGAAVGIFFFVGGIAFMIPKATREIWIGQIWVVVGLVLILVFLRPGWLRSKLNSIFQKTQ